MCQHATPPTIDPTAVSRSTCEQSFPGQPGQVRRARALLTRFLSGCPAGEDTVLLVSELATNAIAHSASGYPGGTFTVRARLSDTGRVYAEVEDQGSGWDGNLASGEPPHGLYLLRQLSTTCGTRPTPHGHITWFTITATNATGQEP